MSRAQQTSSMSFTDFQSWSVIRGGIFSVTLSPHRKHSLPQDGVVKWAVPRGLSQRALRAGAVSGLQAADSAVLCEKH